MVHRICTAVGQHNARKAAVRSAAGMTRKSQRSAAQDGIADRYRGKQIDVAGAGMMRAFYAEITKRNGIVVANLVLHIEIPLLRLSVPEISRKNKKARRAVGRRNGRQQIRI